MAAISFAADSTTVVLDGTIITDFVDGDTVVLTPVNPKTTHIHSTERTNIQEHSGWEVYDLQITVPKSSDADVFLQGKLNESPPAVMAGSVKENYTRDGVEFVSTWTLEGASFMTQPTDTRNVVDGSSAYVYVIRVNRARRLV